MSLIDNCKNNNHESKKDKMLRFSPSCTIPGATQWLRVDRTFCETLEQGAQTQLP